MSRRDTWAVRALLALSPGLVLALVLAGLPAEAPLVAPVLVLLAPLLLGRYLGETHIARLRAGRRRPVPRRRAPAVLVRLPRATFAVLPRGGELLATSFAVRPPPGCSAT